MQATSKYVIPDFTGSLRTLSFMLACLCSAFPMPSNGDPAVGVIQGDVFMSWGINSTDISSPRAVVNPAGSTVIFFLQNNAIGNATPAFSNRVRDIGSVSLGIVSFRLLNLTVADAGKYYYKILPGTDAGGQILVIAGNPANVSVMKVADPIEYETYTMQCSAQSTSVPSGMGLTMYYQWKRENGQNITASDRYFFSSDQSNLIINPLKRQDAGTLVCEAWEHVGAVSQSGPFSLKVIYGPDPGSIRVSPNRTSHEITESSSLTVNCSADCFPDCQYRWTGPGGSTPSNRGLLSIISIGRGHTGQYTCTASNSVIAIKTATAAISVTVFYGPDDRNVILSPSNTSYQLAELSHLDVKCSATCEPQCGYQWSGPLVSQNDTMDLSISQIQRNQNGTFICTVTNPKIPGKSATANFSVVVYYGPGNSVNLGFIPKTLGVDLHQTAPDISCSASCNPPCYYRWYQNENFYRNGATLSLGVIEKTTRGIYRCEAYNTVLGVNRSSSISVSITIYYAPEVLLKPAILPKPSVYILKLGQTNVGLTCVVIDANPPAQRFIWTKDGREILTQTSPTFAITMVTKETMGRWGCKGMNSKGNPLESILDVDVHYGPIIANLPSVIKVEGYSINVSCIVDSRPDPSFISWAKSQNNTFTQNKAEFYIAHLNRADKGTYECTAVNTIQPTGESVGERITVKSSFTLDVTFAPEMSVKVEPPIVEVNSEVHIECSAQGEPSNYKFYDWIHKLGNNEVRHIKGILANQSISWISFPSITIADMGTYICLVDNSITGPDGSIVQSMEAQIDVVGVPVAFIRDTVFIGETNRSSSIQVPFFSNPLITTLKFFKTWNNAPIANDTDTQVYFTEANISTVFYNTNVVLQGMVAVLHFRSLKESDFGQYTLVLYNNKGTATLSVHLQALEPHTEADIRPSIAGIAGGIGGGVVAILVTGVVIFLWRRHSHANKAAVGTACIPTAVDYEALQATRNEGSLYQELSDIKSCADTKNSFRMNGTNTTENQPAYINTKETSCNTQDQDYFTKGENKIYENTRVQT